MNSISRFTDLDALRTRWAIYWDTVMVPHYRRYWMLWVALLAGIVGFNANFTLAINVSESLPDHVYLVVKGETVPKRGEYVAFRWAGGGGYPAGLRFVKQVRGLPGDRVEITDRNFFVNGEFVGLAKERSKKGQPLALGPAGIIPPGHFYAYAPHKDSLDSRYAITGWVSMANVSGRAIPIF